MRKTIIASLKTKLETISGLSVFGPAFASAFEGNQKKLGVFINNLPAVILDFRSEDRKRSGNNYQRTYNGKLIVAVLDFDEEKAFEDLSDNIDLILTELLAIPTPVIDSVYLRLNFEETQPGQVREIEEGQFLIYEIIPMRIEYWK